MPINRGPFNALVDDSGSGTIGTVWNKTQIKDVILDPVDVALVSLGLWTDVVFNAANFTANSGTWAIGTVLTNAYALTGKTMVYVVALQNCVISATPTTLIMALPPGLTTQKFATGTGFYVDGGVVGTGVVYAEAGGTTLKFVRDLGFSPWVADGGSAVLYASITVAIT